MNFEPCFQLFRKIELRPLKNPSQSIFVKNKEKGYQQCGLLSFTMMITLESYLYMKISLAKNQLWIRSWTSVKEYMKEKPTTWGGYVTQSIGTVCGKPRFRFNCSELSGSTVHFKGKRSLEASCLCHFYFDWIQRTIPNFVRLYVYRQLKSSVMLCDVLVQTIHVKMRHDIVKPVKF